MQMTKKVLVLGGYGVFGGRICGRLSVVSDIEIIIAGRSLEKAEERKTKLKSAKATLSTLALDVKDIEKSGIKKMDIFLLINASGPYHKQDYSVAAFCIKNGIHYIDLSDNRAFVTGISELDHAAKEKNVLVVSGASTVPAISSMAIDHFAPLFSEIHELDYGAGPGNQTDRGVSTVAAILSYVGKPFTSLRRGKQKTIYGWQDLHHEHYPEIGMRWMSNCNVPDLDLFPARYKHLKELKFYGGLELSILHVGLWLLSWPSRWGLLPRPDDLAKPLRTISLWFYNFGTDHGGMHVIIRGLGKDQKPLEKRWYLMGMRGDGPYIPTTPPVLVAKKLLDGSLQETGAKPCMGLFSKDEFLEETRDLNIYEIDDTSLYPRYLKERFHVLPKKVQELHDFKKDVLYKGEGRVERGNNPFCQFVCFLLSLPSSGDRMDVSVYFEQEGGAEHWNRQFGRQKYYSKQWDQHGYIYEKIGITTFVFEIETTPEKLSLKLKKLYALGVRMDWLFKPNVVAEEYEENGKFRFHVEANLPLFGLLVKYTGWLDKAHSGL